MVLPKGLAMASCGSFVAPTSINNECPLDQSLLGKPTEKKEARRLSGGPHGTEVESIVGARPDNFTSRSDSRRIAYLAAASRPVDRSPYFAARTGLNS
jgi:hypothetical protein